MVFDAFTFFNELDLLELRLNLLDPFVDKFILTESPETFTGLEKPLYYAENKDRFAKWNDKIIHNIVPRIEAETPFDRAYYQKESALKHITDPEAEVYFGDLDEIWTPQTYQIEKPFTDVIKLRQYNYAYYLNLRSSEDWYGTIYGRRKQLDEGLNFWRANADRIPDYAGWHFTNMGGIEQIIKKVQSYDHAHEINQDWFKATIEANFGKKDYLQRTADYQGKPFEFWVEEENWPQYLKDNKERYQHLCRVFKL